MQAYGMLLAIGSLIEKFHFKILTFHQMKRNKPFMLKEKKKNNDCEKISVILLLHFLI